MKTGGTAGVVWLVGSLICGIVALIGVFLPWVEVIGYRSISGWNTTEIAGVVGHSYPWPYYVFGGSITMIVFTACAIFTTCRYKSRIVKRAFIWIARIGSLVAIIITPWSFFSLVFLRTDLNVAYGLILSGMAAFIGLIGLFVAAVKFDNPRNLVQQQGESIEEFRARIRAGLEHREEDNG
jgi:hypothetical protein